MVDLYWIGMVRFLDNSYYIFPTPDGKGINDFVTKENTSQFFNRAFTSVSMENDKGFVKSILNYVSIGPKMLNINRDTLIKKLIGENKQIEPVVLDGDFGKIKLIKCNAPLEDIIFMYDSGVTPKIEFPYSS